MIALENSSMFFNLLIGLSSNSNFTGFSGQNLEKFYCMQKLFHSHEMIQISGYYLVRHFSGFCKKLGTVLQTRKVTLQDSGIYSYSLITKELIFVLLVQR